MLFEHSFIEYIILMGWNSPQWNWENAFSLNFDFFSSSVKQLSNGMNWFLFCRFVVTFSSVWDIVALLPSFCQAHAKVIYRYYLVPFIYYNTYSSGKLLFIIISLIITTFLRKVVALLPPSSLQTLTVVLQIYPRSTWNLHLLLSSLFNYFI